MDDVRAQNGIQILSRRDFDSSLAGRVSSWVFAVAFEMEGRSENRVTPAGHFLPEILDDYLYLWISFFFNLNCHAATLQRCMQTDVRANGAEEEICSPSPRAIYAYVLRGTVKTLDGYRDGIPLRFIQSWFGSTRCRRVFPKEFGVF